MAAATRELPASGYALEVDFLTVSRGIARRVGAVSSPVLSFVRSCFGGAALMDVRC